jgi:KaiC/GvpD/RAD55 family RecA-like ATPase
MKTLRIKKSWFEQLFPEGFSYPSSTIISGKGGTGKPLVELAFVSQWIKKKLPIIAIPLQYPSLNFIQASLKNLFGIQKIEYLDKLWYIHFNPEINKLQQFNEQEIAANLLKETHWDKILKIAFELKEKYGDVMLFGTAFNLLLYAPSYQASQVEIIKRLLENNQGITSFI